MPLTEAPSIAGSEPLPSGRRAGVSLRFVIGLGVSLILHGGLLGLLMMQVGPAGAPITAPASALLIEWREAVSAAPAPPPPAPSRTVAPVATTGAQKPDPATVMAVPAAAAEAQVESEAAAASTIVESAPPPSPSPPAAASPPSAAADAYLWDVLAHLRRFQHYPERARRDGVEGTVWLRARVSRRGEVLRAEIEHSSGDDLLDGAAARLIARASPLPAPPAGAFAITDLRLPVEYRLSRE
jgi:protein TonB